MRRGPASRARVHDELLTGGARGARLTLSVRTPDPHELQRASSCFQSRRDPSAIWHLIEGLSLGRLKSLCGQRLLPVTFLPNGPGGPECARCRELLWENAERG